MTSLEFDRDDHYSDRRRRDRRDYLALMVVSYPIFFVACVAGRLVRSRERDATGSIFAEARRATEAAIPFALR
jgi:hypothetical protein